MGDAHGPGEEGKTDILGKDPDLGGPIDLELPDPARKGGQHGGEEEKDLDPEQAQQGPVASVDPLGEEGVQDLREGEYE